MLPLRTAICSVIIVIIVGLLSTYFLPIKPTQAYHPGMSASVVIGQRNVFEDYYADEDHVAGVANPRDVTSDGTKLVIADSQSHRVLIYNSIPTTNGIAADVVIGQPDFLGKNVNQGNFSLPTAKSMYNPSGVAIVAGKLIVTDTSNNRVLIYNSIPSANNTAADVVIGQSTMTARASGISATELNSPTKSFYDTVSGKLFIADTNNHRVLIYNSIPTTNGAAANAVIGQPNLTANSANQGGSAAANTLRYPTSAKVFNNKLAISEGHHTFPSSSDGNNRVLIYNTIPSTNNVAADVVIGQPDFATVTAGNTASKMRSPGDIGYDGTNLLVYDVGNHRVLVFSGIPSTSGAAALQAVGQSTLTNSSCGTASASRLCNTQTAYGGIHFVNSHLLVSDMSRNRVLRFNSLITNAPASNVIGQNDFVSTNRFMGVVNNAQRFNWVEGVATHNGKLFIADSGSNRVLIYNSIPTSNFATPDVVIGQPNLTSVSADQGGSIAANTLDYPRTITFAGDKLIISDSGNNRILIYNSIPTTNNASADIVIGQNDFISSTSTPISASKFSDPSATFDPVSEKLFVSEFGRNRVTVFNDLPTTNGASADLVIGQPDFVTTTDDFGSTVNAQGFDSPTIAKVIEGKLFIPDYWNHRILAWNSIPLTNGEPADFVLGQPDFTSNSPNQGAPDPSANTFYYSSDIEYDGNRFFVNDNANWRVLIYNEIPTQTNQSADNVIGQPDLISTYWPGQLDGTVFELDYASQVMALADNKLILADSYHNRVLIFDNPIPEGSTLIAPALTSDKTPAFNWSFVDDDPQDTQHAYQMQLDTVNTFDSPNLRDTGTVVSSATTHTVSSNLTTGIWYARIRLTDSQGDTGDWGAVLTMTITDQVVAKPSLIKVEGTLVDTPSKVLVDTQRPTFSGSAEAGSTVTVTIALSSGPLVLSATADKDGNWSITPTSDLPDGDYQVSITATSEGITSEAATFVLGVNSGAIPETGGSTWPLRVGGALLLASGISLLYWQRQRMRAVISMVPPLFPN